MRVWVTRARPGAETTAERLAARGFFPIVLPLLDIRSLNVAPDLTGVECLAFTSVNGVCAFAAGTAGRSWPVMAVGDATANAALAAGFIDVRSAGGDMAALAALIRVEAAGRSILHPCAVEPAGDLARAVGDVAVVRSVPVYGALASQAPAPEAWEAVLLHSPKAAQLLSTTLSIGQARQRIAIAISAAAAAPVADSGFHDVRVAAAPTEAALLDALGNPAPGV